MTKRSFTEKAALAAGTMAAATAPAIGEAAAVRVTGAPVTLSLGGGPAFAAWDVDGVNGADFSLNRRKSSFATTWFSSRTIEPPGTGFGYQVQYKSAHVAYRQEHIALASVTPYGAAPLNGRGLVVPQPNWSLVQPLGASFQVGPTLAAYHWGAAPGGTYRDVLGRYSRISNRYSTVGAYPSFVQNPTATNTQTNFTNGTYGLGGNLAPGPSIIGFRFDGGLGGLNYGWAVVEWDLGTPGAEAFTIKEWTYETTPDTPVHVTGLAAVPVSPSIVPALTLLGLGAGGVRQLRRRR